MTDKYQFTTDTNLLVTICIHKNKNPEGFSDAAYWVEWATNRESITQGNLWLDYDTKTIMEFSGQMSNSVKLKLRELGWKFSPSLYYKVVKRGT